MLIWYIISIISSCKGKNQHVKEEKKEKKKESTQKVLKYLDRIDPKSKKNNKSHFIKCRYVNEY